MRQRLNSNNSDFDLTVEIIEKELSEYRKLKRFLTVREVAEFFDVSGKTVRKWIHRGDLHAILTNKEWKIPRESIIQFVKERSNFNID